MVVKSFGCFVVIRVITVYIISVVIPITVIHDDDDIKIGLLLAVVVIKCHKYVLTEIEVNI